MATTEYEYVVVGSGAGGGVVAARLALAGRRVLLLEAGGDPVLECGDGSRLPEDYQVPCFHAFSTENPDMRWDYWVRHYGDDARQQRDPKYSKDHDGILYPRAGTLGGCTAHNAMVTIYPHNDDWDHLASLTGDSSWKASRMRRYFVRLENCQYRPVHRWLSRIPGLNVTRHGFNGWLSTELALPLEAVHDPPLVETLAKSVAAALDEIGYPVEQVKWGLKSGGDPNDWRVVKENAFGVRALPLATNGHCRNGTREFLLDTAAKHPDRLKIELHALATRVTFDENNRGTGVEYLKGRRLFGAHPDPSSEPGEPRSAGASREVILAGGAFNTPHLLMLSGIGPKCELDKYNIPVRVDLPGVGRNLQDRYELGLVNRMKENWSVLKGAKFARGDPQFIEWNGSPREGVYTTNGAVMSVIKRSESSRPLPDLFLFGLMGKFYGYFPGYSELFKKHLNYFTWAILKAHTNNTAGEVKLQSSDPRVPPRVDFHYFDEGNDSSKQDLESVVDGVLFARTLTQHLGDMMEEELPGKDVASREDLRQFIKDNAWGHHASCTCPIGPRENNGVLDGNFQVHGTKNLRVVDASVFPRIPGFFIATSVYMVGEKASDVILAASGER